MELLQDCEWYPQPKQHSHKTWKREWSGNNVNCPHSFQDNVYSVSFLLFGLCAFYKPNVNLRFEF